MTEIPEHLRKRAEEARQKAAALEAAEPTRRPRPPRGGDAPQSEAASRIPAHLLERAKKAREQGRWRRRRGGGTATATAPVAAAAPPTAVATAAPPVAAGPGGHTQRLLTVVKSGSIQDVKAMPQDKVHVWPHLLAVEFVAALLCTAFLLIFSIFVNAPLLTLANTNQTPNPSKAPWYFLGLQELLTMFHPMVAGVTIPGMGLFALILAPVHRPQPEQQARGPQVRHLAVHGLHHVLGGPRHDRLVLPRTRVQLRVPVGRRPLLRAVGGSDDMPPSSSSPSPSWCWLRSPSSSPSLRRRDAERAVGLPVPRDQEPRQGRPRPRRDGRARRPPGREVELAAAVERARRRQGARRRRPSAAGRRASPPDADALARHPAAVPQPRHRRRLRPRPVGLRRRRASPSSGPRSAAASARRSRSARSPTSRARSRRTTASSTTPRAACGSRSTRPRRSTRPSRCTRRPSWPAWRPGSSRSTRSACTSAAACRSAPPRSGSSARATARSTTRSVRRRAARRRVASTASP